MKVGTAKVLRPFAKFCEAKFDAESRFIGTKYLMSFASLRITQHFQKVLGGVPSRIRTCDLRIRSPSLYPSELWGHMC